MHGLFANDSACNDADRIMVQSMNKLGLTTAEPVENGIILDKLSEIRADFAQRYRQTDCY